MMDTNVKRQFVSMMAKELCIAAKSHVDKMLSGWAVKIQSKSIKHSTFSIYFPTFQSIWTFCLNGFFVSQN